MKSWLNILLMVTALAGAEHALAQGSEHGMCFKAAADRFSIDPLLLMAMAEVESNYNPSAVNRSNKNGTADFGMMQKNSAAMPLLIEAGFKQEDLFDPCTSIYIGAYDLHSCIKRHGNTWRAVGCYNAGSKKSREEKREIYVRKVHKAYVKLKHRQMKRRGTS